jgi:hypothetical protein
MIADAETPNSAPAGALKPILSVKVKFVAMSAPKIQSVNARVNIPRF